MMKDYKLAMTMPSVMVLAAAEAATAERAAKSDAPSNDRDDMRTLPKDSLKNGKDGLEPARVHHHEKMNRKAKRRAKHLHKKLNHRKGFRHGQG